MNWEEIAQDVLRQREVPYFSNVLDSLRTRLPSIAYAVIAAACAERLLSRHLQLPSSSQRPFTASCRQPLDCIWGVLAAASDSVAFRRDLERWLHSYYDSPLNHSDGQDGPDDADHDPAAATIFAAESLIQSSPESAGHAMGRVMDDAFYRATDDREAATPPTRRVDDFIADCCHPIVQDELRWLQRIFSYVQSHDLSHATVTELRHQANA
ncbi:MAG TPA: hypothetical protein VGM54_06325 [Chthoniobacter sp.]|jgi:hypothetical protein